MQIVLKQLMQVCAVLSLVSRDVKLDHYAHPHICNRAGGFVAALKSAPRIMAGEDNHRDQDHDIAILREALGKRLQ
jgi:hypothetical protein